MDESTALTPAWDERGLAPAIVQDHQTGEVLMLAWMNAEALERTIESGVVHFWSRSRQELWEKGATSGNRLHVQSMSSDCDEDTILVQVRPDGPACHTGSRTCFVRSADPGPQGFADLERLWDRIQQRLRVGDASSYTVRLLDGGVDAAGRKVIEEAAEVVEAAQQHDRGIADDTRLAEESADLMYHLLALLAERDVSPSQLIEELAGRR